MRTTLCGSVCLIFVCLCGIRSNCMVSSHWWLQIKVKVQLYCHFKTQDCTIRRSVISRFIWIYNMCNVSVICNMHSTKINKKMSSGIVTRHIFVIINSSFYDLWYMTVEDHCMNHKHTCQWRAVNNQWHLTFLWGSHLTLSWLCVFFFFSLSQGVLVLSQSVSGVMVITKVGKLESMKSYSSTHVIYITRLNRYVFMAVTLHSKICNWWSRLESWANYSLGCSCFAKDTLFSTTSNFRRNTFRNLVPLESSLIEPIMPFIVLHRLVSHHIQRFSLRGIRQVVSALWRDLLLLFDRVTRGHHPKFVIQLWPDRRRNADPVSGTMLPALCLL